MSPQSAPVATSVAAFDFDGTLTRGGSVWKFLAAQRGRRAVLLAAIRLTPDLVRAALLGGMHADRAKERLFTRVLAGLDANDAAVVASRFGVEHYERHAREEVRTRLEAHREAGHAIVVVSASPELYVEPVARLIGAHGTIATRLEVDAGGRLTGRYEGANCRGQEKLRRLDAWIDRPAPAGAAPGGAAGADPQVPRPAVWAYGNSAGDRQMLAGADVGIDVGKLGRLGKLRGFRRLADAPSPGGLWTT